ncbi:MAG: YbdK family carboxylate-amine ligase [Planctomycetes bacterium]|nr:YbdK family carboxylate-amine ligase [Planctomycetota bacterium]
MSKVVFTSNDSPTLGIELEFGLIDAETMALSNSIQQVLDQLPHEEVAHFKPELMQSCIEVNTGICNTVGEAEIDLRQKIETVQRVIGPMGMHLWWGATHPFSLWQDQKVTPDDRYAMLVSLLQDMARRLVTFGLHIHVGVDSGDKAVMICDRMMQHLPMLLALSCSSPFWENRKTGLQSYRSKIMEGLPTAGLPTLMRNWSEYVWLVNHMVSTGFINTIREIWWDIRPHHNFGTVEVRVCDMPGNLDDAMSIAAMTQCLIKALSDDIDNGAYQHDCHPMMVRQNKWRACRFGVSAQLVNSYSYEVQPVTQIVENMIERLRPAGEELGCLDYLERNQALVAAGTAADRQLQIMQETGDPAEVVRQMIQQSRLDPVASKLPRVAGG